MLSPRNGYVYPFVLWLSLIFLSVTLTMVSVYENDVETYDELMNQLEIQSVMQVIQKEIILTANESEKYVDNYETIVGNSFVNITKQEEINEKALFSAIIEYEDKVYRRSFFLNSINH